MYLYNNAHYLLSCFLTSEVAEDPKEHFQKEGGANCYRKHFFMIQKQFNEFVKVIGDFIRFSIKNDFVVVDNVHCPILAVRNGGNRTIYWE